MTRAPRATIPFRPPPPGCHRVRVGLDAVIARIFGRAGADAPAQIDVTPAEASQRLNVRPYTLRRLIALGEVRLSHERGRPMVRIPAGGASSRVTPQPDEMKEPAGPGLPAGSKSGGLGSASTPPHDRTNTLQ